jgi:hypothetical protein
LKIKLILEGLKGRSLGKVEWMLGNVRLSRARKVMYRFMGMGIVEWKRPRTVSNAIWRELLRKFHILE